MSDSSLENWVVELSHFEADYLAMQSDADGLMAELVEYLTWALERGGPGSLDAGKLLDKCREFTRKHIGGAGSEGAIPEEMHQAVPAATVSAAG